MITFLDSCLQTEDPPFETKLNYTSRIQGPWQEDHDEQYHLPSIYECSAPRRCTVSVYGRSGYNTQLSGYSWSPLNQAASIPVGMKEVNRPRLTGRQHWASHFFSLHSKAILLACFQNPLLLQSWNTSPMWFWTYPLLYISLSREGYPQPEFSSTDKSEPLAAGLWVPGMKVHRVPTMERR